MSKYSIQPLHKHHVPSVTVLLNQFLSFGLTTEARIDGYLNDPEVIAFVVIGDADQDNDAHVNNEIAGFVKCHKIGAFTESNYDDKKLQELGYTSEARTFLIDKTQTMASQSDTPATFLSLDLIVVVPESRGAGLFQQLTQQCISCYASILPSSTQIHLIGFSWLRTPQLEQQVSKSSLHCKRISQYWIDQGLPCDICGSVCQCDAIVFIK